MEVLSENVPHASLSVLCQISRQRKSVLTCWHSDCILRHLWHIWSSVPLPTAMKCVFCGSNSITRLHTHLLTFACQHRSVVFIQMLHYNHFPWYGATSHVAHIVFDGYMYLACSVATIKRRCIFFRFSFERIERFWRNMNRLATYAMNATFKEMVECGELDTRLH